MTLESNTPKLVILDDEQEIVNALIRVMHRIDVDIAGFTSPWLALEYIEENDVDLVISDQRMPSMSGIEFLNKVKDISPNSKRIMLSGHQDFDAVAHGFNEHILDLFISKPWQVKELIAAVNNHLSKVNNYNTKSNDLGIITADNAMNELMSQIKRAAGANVPVFIHGETGTGKELVARACHDLGCKQTGEFVALNCANLSPELIESQLFGHVKGAFTGANKAQAGVFESANGGTVFLDEMTTLPLDLQAKLLRVLQERVYSPVGSIKEVPFDAQIISASSTSLQDAVTKGQFREDLFYRLNVISLAIPPLRNRGNDSILLANYFIEKYDQGKDKCLDDSALSFIKSQQWPGNVRQLENALQGLCIMEEKTKITADILSKYVVNPDPSCSSDQVVSITSAAQPKEVLSIAQAEKAAIEHAMQVCEGNVHKAAVLLDVNPSTLYRKIKRWQR